LIPQYAITHLNGTVVSSQWLSFNASTLNLTIQSSLPNDLGVHNLLLVSFFSNPATYNVSSPLTVNIISACMKNTIIA